MTHLVNGLDDVVTEALDALVRSSGGALGRLDGYPDIKVVLRTDWQRDRVAVVSGGGAGHEPAHAGFVGRGLLTAAVSGEIFASPGVDAVLAAILAVTGDAGCLVVVKNYTGDRLNFGLAVERARGRGLDVRMVVVSDDVALPGSTQPRGLAGTLLVHKVAGALAERGAGLDEVAAAAEKVAAGVRSLGVSLSAVAIPGRGSEDRVADGTVELGMGIHGEPGARTVELDGSADLVRQMSATLAEQLPDGPVALLVNDLGGLSGLETAVVLHDVLDGPLGARTRLLVGPAALMTSLSARGMSLTALPLDDQLEQALQDEVAAHTAWPGARVPGEVVTTPLPDLGTETWEASSSPRVREVLDAVCAAVEGHQDALDALDAQVGDGDTGSTFAGGARRVRAELDALPLADTAALLGALSALLTGAMGGSSGVLGSVFFAAARTSADAGATLGQALADGTDAVRRTGGAEPGDRTLLDALVPATDLLRDGGSLAAAPDAAEAGAEETAGMTTARAGRSAYVPSEHLRVQDPGAAAVAIMLRAAADA
ncbi:dihydroxyacetone kinase subunit DhaK [Aquipuribacter hungaricus]|uniref:Dihydroxyacetone kinase subunit DhaK n=1 Tax=Aquipuribacter hungaricus TaxID=545624 RepID=A0ABV7WEQ0_9MICO